MEVDSGTATLRNLNGHVACGIGHNISAGFVELAYLNLRRGSSRAVGGIAPQGEGGSGALGAVVVKPHLGAIECCFTRMSQRHGAAHVHTICGAAVAGGCRIVVAYLIVVFALLVACVLSVIDDGIAVRIIHGQIARKGNGAIIVLRERELAVVDQILEGSFPSRLLTIDRSAEVEIARVFVTEDAREILATRLADDGKRHLGSEHLVDGVFIGILAISVARVIVGVDNAPVDSLGIA